MMTKLFVLFSILAWVTWAVAYFSFKDANPMKDSACGNLIALRSRVELSEDKPIDQSFRVNYNERYYIGLDLDDSQFADSLERYIGFYAHPDFGFAVKWTLYEDEDSLRYSSLTYPTGVSGKTLIFGKFHGYAERKYRIRIHSVTLPSGIVKDSAWFEVGVNRAAFSVGIDFSYRVANMLFTNLHPLALWLAAGLSLISLLMWAIRRRGHINSP